MTQPPPAAPSVGAADAIRDFAWLMAGRYDATVYLVGSSLTSDTPRDVDIRVMLSDAEFERRYGGHVACWIAEGETGAWTSLRHGWSADCTAQTHRAWKMTGQNVDFQVYPESWATEQYGDQPRLVLAEATHA